MPENDPSEANDELSKAETVSIMKQAVRDTALRQQRERCRKGLSLLRQDNPSEAKSKSLIERVILDACRGRPEKLSLFLDPFREEAESLGVPRSKIEGFGERLFDLLEACRRENESAPYDLMNLLDELHVIEKQMDDARRDRHNDRKTPTNPLIESLKDLAQSVRKHVRDNDALEYMRSKVREWATQYEECWGRQRQYDAEYQEHIKEHYDSAEYRECIKKRHGDVEYQKHIKKHPDGSRYTDESAGPPGEGYVFERFPLCLHPAFTAPIRNGAYMGNPDDEKTCAMWFPPNLSRAAKPKGPELFPYQGKIGRMRTTTPWLRLCMMLFFPRHKGRSTLGAMVNGTIARWRR